MPGTSTMSMPVWLAERQPMTSFDLAGFVRAVQDKDADAWCDFFAADAEWLEYRDHTPPRDPDWRRGNLAIHSYIKGLCASASRFHVEDPVAGVDSIWYRLMVRQPDGRMVIEHVHLQVVAGQITREIDVEAFDYQ